MRGYVNDPSGRLVSQKGHIRSEDDGSEGSQLSQGLIRKVDAAQEQADSGRGRGVREGRERCVSKQHRVSAARQPFRPFGKDKIKQIQRLP